MSIITIINKLSSDFKKVSEEHYQTEEEIKQQKASLKLLPVFNKNSIGYKIKYIFQLDNEFKNEIHFYALQIITNYLLESFILLNENCFFKYEFYIHDNNLILSLFHTNSNYLEDISNNLIQYISSEINNLSSKIKPQFIDQSSSLRTKIKIINKDFPIIIDILCNLINDKDLHNKSNDIIDAIIRFIFNNDVKIFKFNDIKITTFRSQEDAFAFLENKRKNDSNNTPIKNKKNKNDTTNKDPEEKKLTFLTNEIINENMKQLFWHTMERKQETIKSDWMNSAVFLTVCAIITHAFPNYLQKFLDFKHSNSIIDNILDLATEDLSTMIPKKQNFASKDETSTKSSKSDSSTINNHLSDKIIKDKELQKILKNEFLDDIPEYFSIKESNDHISPRKKNENDFESITRNILKKFNNNDSTSSSVEIRNIENRLRDILEETDTKT